MGDTKWDPLGTRSVNLFDDSPGMQTLQAMHMLVATHPMVQANFLLLMENLLHTELLCTQGVFLGRRGFGGASNFRCPPIEDDWASTSEPGIANFVRSGLHPLSARGRGSTDGHGQCPRADGGNCSGHDKMATTHMLLWVAHMCACE